MSSMFVAEKATAPVINAEMNQFISVKLEKRNYFVDAPNVIGDSSVHRRRDAQRLVNASEVAFFTRDVQRWFCNVVENRKCLYKNSEKSKIW
jgi:hypothetical protein